MLTRNRLELLLENFSKLTIGLVGDLFLDRYLMIEPGIEEMSVETDLEAHQIQEVRNYPGALGTVMNNLTALGVHRVLPVTVIGDDGQGFDLLKEVSKLPADVAGVLQTANRLTPTYTKPMKQSSSGDWCELNRLDLRTRGPIDEETTELLARRLRDMFAAVDGLIVLDQIDESDWGVVNTSIRGALDELAAAEPEKLIFVDSRSRIGHFNSGVLKGNLSEMVKAAGLDSDDPQHAVAAAAPLSRKTGRAVFCTMGAEGILVAFPDQSPIHVSGFPVKGPVDICGAGDSATSGAVLSLCSEATAAEAATVANLVASITVQQIGITGTATPEQVLGRFDETLGN